MSIRGYAEVEKIMRLTPSQHVFSVGVKSGFSTISNRWEQFDEISVSVVYFSVDSTLTSIRWVWKVSAQLAQCVFIHSTLPTSTGVPMMRTRLWVDWITLKLLLMLIFEKYVRGDDKIIVEVYRFIRNEYDLPRLEIVWLRLSGFISRRWREDWENARCKRRHEPWSFDR